jgi:Domain of unknown function (DUF4760)
MSSTILRSKFLFWLFVIGGMVAILTIPFLQAVKKNQFYELSFYEWLSLGVGLLQATIYALTLLAISYQIETEYAKNKKNQTIHAMADFLEFKFELNKEMRLVSSFADSELKNLITSSNLSEDQREVKIAVTRLLDKCEHLSVCIKSDLYDLEFVNKVCGSLLVTIYTQFQPYIEQTRLTRNNKLIYKQFQQVHTELRILRSLKN